MYITGYNHAKYLSSSIQYEKCKIIHVPQYYMVIIICFLILYINYLIPYLYCRIPPTQNLHLLSPSDTPTQTYHYCPIPHSPYPKPTSATTVGLSTDVF